MPAVKPGAKVLVTGANGYIAVWIVKYLLEKGFSVRGTIRSHAKGEYLKQQFSSYGDKLELLAVADITETGAFDKAVQGVDVILHTASPFHLNAVEPSEIIEPAVKGTTGILVSALKHSGAQLQRVVVLSSVASVSDSTEHGILDEKNWNTGSIAEVEGKGKDADAGAKYRASKTLAERAAWDFVEKHKSEIKWDLVTLCPPFVFGPVIHDISSPEGLGTSAAMFYQIIVKGVDPSELLLTESWIDVRDVATAHILAIESDKAGGERFVISAGPVIFEKFTNAWNELIAANPSYAVAADGSKSALGKAVPVKRNFEFNNTKSKEVLRLTYRDEKETLVDSVLDFKAKGWM